MEGKIRQEVEESGICDKATKDTARREEVGASYIEKGTGILWEGKYTTKRHTFIRERMDK